jgi:ketosteroid isomerase-like protein
VFAIRMILLFALAFAGGRAAVAADSDEALRDVLMNLTERVNSGAADKAAQLWTENAILIDQCGNEVSGREAISERFKHVTGGGAIAIHPEQIDYPSADVAFVLGSTSRGEGTAMTPVGKFSALLVRKDNQWLISRATDTAVQATAFDHLQQLDWLVGKWAAGADNKLDVHWAPGKNFLLLNCENKSDSKVESDTHVIGWDPNSNSIVSWHFDYLGGFGRSNWNQQANQWLIDYTGVAADGQHTHSIDVCSPVSADEFSWRAARKGIGPLAVSGAPAVTWKRLSK